MPKSSVFNAVMRLKKSGMISFIEDEDDLRKSYVVPTKQCLEHREEMWKKFLGLQL